MTEARASHVMYASGPYRPSTPAMFVLAALWMCPLVASAQSVDLRDVSNPEIDAQVKEQLVVGTAAYRKRKYNEAWTALNAAWLLKQSGAISAMLAEVEMKLGRYDQAATHWAYAKEHLPADSRDAFKQATNGLAECKPLVGTLAISLNPARADVIIDRKLVEVRDTAMQAWVTPGVHTILGVVDGSRFSAPETFEISPGETRHIDIDVTQDPLKQSETSPPLPPLTAPTPLPVTQSTAKHKAADVRTIVVGSGAGLTLLALGLGTWFGLHRSTLQDTIIELQTEIDRSNKSSPRNGACAPGAVAPPSTCGALREAIGDYNRNTHLANASFVMAAGFGVTTMALYLLWPVQTEKTQALVRPIAIAPWWTQHSKGIDLQLRF